MRYTNIKLRVEHSLICLCVQADAPLEISHHSSQNHGLINMSSSVLLINFISCLTLSRKQLPPLNKLKSLQLDDFLVDHSSFPVKQRGLLIVIVNNHKFNYKSLRSQPNLQYSFCGHSTLAYYKDYHF